MYYSNSIFLLKHYHLVKKILHFIAVQMSRKLYVIVHQQPGDFTLIPRASEIGIT